MANVNHSTLTDPYLHEPKGVSSASSGQVYIANGTGSGVWTKSHAHIHGYIDFDAVTPAYTHSVTTGWTILNPTFSTNLVDGFTGTTTPNARLVYTGTEDSLAFLNFVFNFRQASGTNKDLEVLFYRNGLPIDGGHIIVTASSGVWKSASLFDGEVLSTNDYIEIAVKGDSSFTLEIASADLIINGVPV